MHDNTTCRMRKKNDQIHPNGKYLYRELNLLIANIESLSSGLSTRLLLPLNLWCRTRGRGRARGRARKTERNAVLSYLYLLSESRGACVSGVYLTLHFFAFRALTCTCNFMSIFATTPSDGPISFSRSGCISILYCARTILWDASVPSDTTRILSTRTRRINWEYSRHQSSFE